MSSLTLHKLEVLCTVVELGSVSRAAERLGIAQPVVSAHLRSIEERTGLKLTNRHGRSIAVTADGRRVYEWGRDVVVRTREFERQLAGGDRPLGGRLAIAASLTAGGYVLPPHLAALRVVHPEIAVAVRVGTPADCIAAIREGISDIAFTLIDPSRDLADFDVEALWTERLLLVAAPRSRHVGAPVVPGDLATLPFVTAEQGSARRNIEEAALRERGIARGTVVLEIGHSEGMKAAVAADMGVAFLFTASVQREIDARHLRVVTTGDLEIAAPVYRVQRRGKRLSDAQRYAADFLCAALRTAG